MADKVIFPPPRSAVMELARVAELPVIDATQDAESRALAVEKARRRREGEEVAARRGAGAARNEESGAFAGPPAFIPAGPQPAIVERANARGFRTAAEMLEADLAELRARLDASERGELLEADLEADREVPVALVALEERVQALELRVGDFGARLGAFGPELEALVGGVGELGRAVGALEARIEELEKHRKK